MEINNNTNNVNDVNNFDNNKIINKKNKEDLNEYSNSYLDFFLNNFLKSKFLEKEIYKNIFFKNLFHEKDNLKDLNEFSEEKIYELNFDIKENKKIINVNFLSKNQENQENFKKNVKNDKNRTQFDLIKINIEDDAVFFDEKYEKIGENLEEITISFKNSSKRTKKEENQKENEEKNEEKSEEENKVICLDIFGKIKDKNINLFFNSDEKIILNIDMLYETELSFNENYNEINYDDDYFDYLSENNKIEEKYDNYNEDINNNKLIKTENISKVNKLNIFMKQDKNITLMSINNNKELKDLDINYFILSKNKENESINEINIINNSKNTNLNVKTYGLVKNPKNISNLTNVSSTILNENSKIEEEIKIIDIGTNDFRNVMIPMFDVNNNTSTCNHKAQLIKLNEKNLYYIMTRGFDFNTSKKIILKSLLKNYIDFLENNEIEDLLEY